MRIAGLATNNKCLSQTSFAYRTIEVYHTSATNNKGSTYNTPLVHAHEQQRLDANLCCSGQLKFRAIYAAQTTRFTRSSIVPSSKIYSPHSSAHESSIFMLIFKFDLHLTLSPLPHYARERVSKLYNSNSSEKRNCIYILVQTNVRFPLWDKGSFKTFQTSFFSTLMGTL